LSNTYAAKENAQTHTAGGGWTTFGGRLTNHPKVLARSQIIGVYPAADMPCDLRRVLIEQADAYYLAGVPE